MGYIVQAAMEEPSNGLGIISIPSAGGDCHTRGRRRASAKSCRELLLKAAREVCIHRGVLDATIREIARQAGLSHTMIYYHFGGKEGLACALARNAYHHFREDLADSDASGHPYLRLRGIVDLFRHHLGNRAILGRLFRDPSVARFKTLHGSVLGMQEEIRAWCRDYMEEGQRSGLIRPDLGLDALSRCLCEDMVAFPVAASLAANPLTQALLVGEDSWFENLQQALAKLSSLSSAIDCTPPERVVGALRSTHPFAG